VEDPRLATTVALLFLVAFGIKAALFPLFFWLPASYHVPAVAVSALFAGLLTKVGVYAIARMFTLIFYQEADLTHTLLLVAAVFSMVVGVLGAAAQSEFRRILAFHSVSQVGYIVAALALSTPLAVAGALYFMVHHSMVKANLFFVSGLAYRWHGTGQLQRLGGFFRNAPWLSAMFLITALSLAGLPPLSGFFAKLAVVQAGLETKQYVFVAAALGVGLLTLYSMTKIWNQAFWAPAPDTAVAQRSPLVMLSVITVMTGVTLFLGLGSSFAFGVALEASGGLLSPAAYIDAVLGGRS
jgi:multicomponent Na+:H+ antiporter subunit D